MSGKQIVIIDYGMGNIKSVINALSFLGYIPILSHEHTLLNKADGYILPGVGAFGVAMQNLKKHDLITLLEKNILIYKKPILGICLGMQLLAKSSTEEGFCDGLGFIDAVVEEIPNNSNLRVPHVGWNSLTIHKQNPLFINIEQNTNFYFDHSFHMICQNRDIVSSTTSYGIDIVASVQKENIFATQFHPEKSQSNGLKLLRNFLNFVENDNA